MNKQSTENMAIAFKTFFSVSMSENYTERKKKQQKSISNRYLYYESNKVF